MAITVGASWYVTTVLPNPLTGRGKHQVAWHDTHDTSFGPYLRTELEFNDEEVARAAHVALVQVFKNGSVDPSDPKAVVAAVLDALKP